MSVTTQAQHQIVEIEKIPRQFGYAALAFMQITAGGCAGFVEVCMMHPLDLIKTRFQIQRGPDDPTRYTSMLDCVRKMYRTEGPLSFYKGILPPILAETPKRATKFFTFEQYKKLFLFGAPSPTFITFTLSGLFAGLTEAVIVNPFELVKVQLQAERSKFVQQQSTIAKARNIIRTDGFGLRGINKGLTATMARNGVFNMIYFSFYHNMKQYIPAQKDHRADIACRLGVGFCSGTLASIANIPFDVAKSRIQGPQPQPGVIKYRSSLATVAMVYREEGFFALYKGLLPKVMRLGPGGAIMLVVFETVYEKLQKLFS
jgi:solute carrier family 25 2-oxodicarboxylate transporter 21